MTFNNFEELVHTIENDLGQEFKNDFRNSRKFLAGLTNLPNYIMFSEFDDKKSEWVYKRGRKKEIQYHIFLREGKIGYGLAINSQRGSFNNDDPAEIANDFGKAFKNISDKKAIFLTLHCEIPKVSPEVDCGCLYTTFPTAVELANVPSNTAFCQINVDKSFFVILLTTSKVVVSVKLVNKTFLT